MDLGICAGCGARAAEPTVVVVTRALVTLQARTAGRAIDCALCSRCRSRINNARVSARLVAFLALLVGGPLLVLGGMFPSLVALVAGVGLLGLSVPLGNFVYRRNWRDDVPEPLANELLAAAGCAPDTRVGLTLIVTALSARPLGGAYHTRASIRRSERGELVVTRH